MNPEQAAALRKPFPPEAIGKLPKAGVKLDYVGHAAVTARLLEVDPEWSWEPVAFTEAGEPRIVIAGKEAWLWIRLTVAGVTRLGVGVAPLASFELPKQLISDALRNAAMRFGVALDLWAKEDISHTSVEQAEAEVHPTRSDGIVVRQPTATYEIKTVEVDDTLAVRRRELTARAKALPSKLVADARKAADLPLIKDSDGGALAAWENAILGLETETRPM